MMNSLPKSPLLTNFSKFANNKLVLSSQTLKKFPNIENNPIFNILSSPHKKDYFTGLPLPKDLLIKLCLLKSPEDDKKLIVYPIEFVKGLEYSKIKGAYFLSTNSSLKKISNSKKKLMFFLSDSYKKQLQGIKLEKLKNLEEIVKINLLLKIKTYSKDLQFTNLNEPINEEIFNKSNYKNPIIISFEQLNDNSKKREIGFLNFLKIDKTLKIPVLNLKKVYDKTTKYYKNEESKRILNELDGLVNFLAPNCQSTIIDYKGSDNEYEFFKSLTRLFIILSSN